MQLSFVSSKILFFRFLRCTTTLNVNLAKEIEQHNIYKKDRGDVGRRIGVRLLTRMQKSGSPSTD
jgi:hypothetical protein